MTAHERIADMPGDPVAAAGPKPAAVGAGPGGDVDLPRLRRRTVRVLVLAQVVGGIGVGSSLAVSGLLAEDLSGSQTWSGFAVTAITLGAGLFALPLARVADARGRRVALTLGWSTAACGSLVVILAAVLGWFPLMLAAFVVFGAGSAANLQSRYAAADLADDATRARSLAIVVWSTTVGAVVGPNLNSPGAAVGRALGLPELAGPYVFSALSFVGGALTMWILLRPDPLLTARELAASSAGTGPAAPPPRASMRSSLAVIRSSRPAMLAVASVVLGHAVMVSVMAMTPVHMKDHGAALTLVGLTISLHIAGMYALSPLVGWAADTIGRIPVIIAGQLVLLGAVLVAGLSGHSVPVTMVGLVLLGVGWSCSMVAGSSLLAESVPQAARPSVQGTSDLLMNLAGAAGGALSGSVLAAAGYGGLNAAAGLVVLPVLAVVSGYALGRARRTA
ncbi:MFS transporter [Yinghuangia seranimata]|uniref:MFS transporter n=1 Tax=Yinghuangia seranimata TaxID=408067 RepID=UPI00248B0C34|nr:MFS transporter [Yinghuangia seranimata]MDI2124864.1 MFS transporter [Yinghuangia seranimata]